MERGGLVISSSRIGMNISKLTSSSYPLNVDENVSINVFNETLFGVCFLKSLRILEIFNSRSLSKT